MSNFFAPLYRAFDDNGDPISGAVLYFYATGTTTPLATYPTFALAQAGGGSANANPVVADSDGWFGRIFLRPGYTYTVVLKTAVGGTTIWTQDGVDSALLNSSSLATRITQIASNPMDNGAVGDGTANDYAAVQAAIDAATGVVDLLGKTYRCDTALSLDGGLTIRNGSLDFSNCADNNYLSATGSFNGSAKLLTAGANAGDESITLANVTGLATGDILWLTSGAAYNGATGTDGELCRVTGVVGLVVSLAAPIGGDYALVDGASAQEILTVSDVILDDVIVTASKTAAGTGVLFLATRCDRISVNNCLFTGIKAQGIGLNNSLNVSVTGTRFENGAASAIGIKCVGGVSGVFIGSGSSFATLASGVNIGLDGAGYKGVCRDVRIEASIFDSCTTAGIVAGILSKHLSVQSSMFRATDPANGMNLTSIIDARVNNCTFLGGVYGINDTTVTDLNGLGNYFDGQTTSPVKGATNAVLTITGATGNQAGLVATGSGSGDGVYGTGGATAGDGVTGVGGTGGRGVYGVGDGAGDGVVGLGGATGDGVTGTGGASGGRGVVGVGTGSSYGVSGSGPSGVYGVGTGGGHGVVGQGGATDGNGGVFTGGAADGIGAECHGDGAGSGVYSTGGDASGNGVYGQGGTPNGKGVSGAGQGVGVGVYGVGGGTNAAGVQGVGGSTNGDGVYGVGSGTGSGVVGLGAGTGYGVIAQADTTTPVRASLRIVPQDTAPSSPLEGDVYVHDGSHKIYCYLGGSWVDLTV